MTESKILLANYPKIRQECTFQNSEKGSLIDVITGYDINPNCHEVTIRICRDLINAIISFDYIYIYASNIWDITSVIGTENFKELLRNNIFRVITDKELNPVMLKESGREWTCDFFGYSTGYNLIKENRDVMHNGKWGHVECEFEHHNVPFKDANAIIYMIDEAGVSFDDEQLKKLVIKETQRDMQSIDFMNDPAFWRVKNSNIEYNTLGALRLHSANTTLGIASMLDIDNMNMEAEVNSIINKKISSSPIAKEINPGIGSIEILERKGFPDIGQLFYDNVLSISDILKLREGRQNKKFRSWVNQKGNNSYEMQRDIMNSAESILDKPITKAVRFVITNVLSCYEPTNGLLTSTIDSFIIDKLFKTWHPNIFLDNELKKMIDKSIKKADEETRRRKIEELFANVGRNELCPCGSGKKFKKCHGANL